VFLGLGLVEDAARVPERGIGGRRLAGLAIEAA
jgi:hypothetical protein